jgi:hypothetical protein
MQPLAPDRRNCDVSANYQIRCKIRYEESTQKEIDDQEALETMILSPDPIFEFKVGVRSDIRNFEQG